MVYAELFRFGGTLTILDENREKAEAALMEEYEKMFFAENGVSSKEEYIYDISYYENARTDIEFSDMTPGEVRFL